MPPPAPPPDRRTAAAHQPASLHAQARSRRTRCAAASFPASEGRHRAAVAELQHPPPARLPRRPGESESLRPVHRRASSSRLRSVHAAASANVGRHGNVHRYPPRGQPIHAGCKDFLPCILGSPDRRGTQPRPYRCWDGESLAPVRRRQHRPYRTAGEESPPLSGIEPARARRPVPAPGESKAAQRLKTRAAKQIFAETSPCRPPSSPTLSSGEAPQRAVTEFDTLSECLRALDLRIEIEERVQAHLELRLNLLATAFQHMHRHMRLVAVLQCDGRLTDGGDFVRG